MRKILFLLIFVCSLFGAKADDNISFTTDAPEVVVCGDQFRLVYSINTHKVRDFRAPSIKDLEVLDGPYRSESSSTQIMNGKVTSSKSIRFTYSLMANKEGTFKIPGATIVAEGKTMTSNSVTIKVLPADDASTEASRGQVAGGSVSNKDLFITATASKTTVHEQEAILLTYKVYTLVNLRALRGDMPDLKGFHTQEVELDRQKVFNLEHYKGRNYNTTVWSQYVVFPQKSGKLEIPSITYEATIAQQVVPDDPLDAFFNGGSFREFKKIIQTPKLTINVKELPSKPASYSGGVGDFTISSSINAKEVKANDAITIKVVISGTGNMKLINTPEVKFPQNFEIYDPKVENKFNLTREGLSGNKVIEYLAIPRHPGQFTIPAVEFTYFDLKTNQYKTLTTEAYEVKVNKGEGSAGQVVASFTNKEDLKVLGQDVRYIKVGGTNLRAKGNFFYGSTSYWMYYLVPFLLFVIMLIVYRKQAVENANVAKVKTKKANKVATKRMKAAGKLLAANQKDAFYDEVLKALWGYVSDKLNIPVSKLTKDNVEEKLSQYGIEETKIKEFIDVLNDCEFARFAPGDPNEAMDKVYSSAVEIIGKLENSIKR